MADKEKLGAMWNKSGSNGPYMSGEVEVNGVKVRVVAFVNTYKDDDKKPDWILYKSTPRESREPRG